MMILAYSMRMYLFVYVWWRIVTDSIRNGRPEFSLPENMYLRISDACKALANLHITTDGDESELETTMTVLYLNNNGILTWYPVNKSIVPLSDILIKFYLIIKPLGQNSSDINSYPSNDSTLDTNRPFMWVPINESFVQLDDNMNKWIPINESSVRKRRGDATIDWYPIDESSFRIHNTILKWYPMNDTLVKLKDNLNKSVTQFDNDTIKWYPINDSLVRLDDNTIRWFPIDESLYTVNEDLLLKTKNPDTCDQCRKHLVQEDDTTSNWYTVNETHVALKRPDINVTQETKVIIHGFGASALNAVTYKLALAYYHEQMFNVLLVDAEAMLNKVYFKCVNNARIVGKAIADLIIHLESFGADAADFHLLGVSLGAHIAGWAGKYFRHSEGRRIGRITGLDPAGPCFTNVPSNERLDKTDAMYVDVVHTNAYLQGSFEPLGHADFYLNGGGPHQPGCFLPTCSHLAAAYLYTESIKHPEMFVAVKCDNWFQFKENRCRNKTVIFGHKLPLDTRGLYYLRTTGTRPFGLGMDGIRP